VLCLDDSLKYVTIIPMGSRIPDTDMLPIVSLMQSSCEQASRFVYKSILAPEAQELLQSIHKSAPVPSTPATAAASTVVRHSAPITTVPLAAARLLLARQPGCVVSAPGQQVKIIVGSMEMLQSLSASMQAEGQDDEAELADRSRSPSPPHPIFNGPVVRCRFDTHILVVIHYSYYLHQGGYVIPGVYLFIYLYLSVCLLACQQDHTKSYRQIWLKFSAKVRLEFAQLRGD